MYLQLKNLRILRSFRALGLMGLPSKVLYHEQTTFGKYTGVHCNGWVYDYKTSQQTYDTWL